MSEEENEVEVEDVEEEEDGPVLSKRKARKQKYRIKMESLMAEYRNLMVIGVDNVGSNQMQKVRIALRGKAVILMGKNTIMRKVIRDSLDKYPQYEQLLPYIRGNMGLCMTNGDLGEIRKIILESKVPAAAKTGATAPVDVWVPAGPTGLDPGQTSFFQALDIATKIARGSIEIINRYHLIKEGDKVSASAVALLGKLNILPFFYGITTSVVLDEGSLYEAKFLDMDEAAVLSKFFTGVNMIAAIGLATGMPSAATVPHSLAGAFKKLLAVAVSTEYEFELAKPFKAYLANPDAFKVEEKKEDGDKKEESSSEEEESSSEGGAMGMFGDDDGSDDDSDEEEE